ncbi:hypothetical protein ACFFJN_01600 [Erwinia mallotivora]|uniref:hypothetical protein n=1 Tax=Erwinia mallotivora TaxID=69222 RepID=UPI0035E5B268
MIALNNSTFLLPVRNLHDIDVKVKNDSVTKVISSFLSEVKNITNNDRALVKNNESKYSFENLKQCDQMSIIYACKMLFSNDNMNSEYTSDKLPTPERNNVKFARQSFVSDDDMNFEHVSDKLAVPEPDNIKLARQLSVYDDAVNLEYTSNKLAVHDQNSVKIVRQLPVSDDAINLEHISAKLTNPEQKSVGSQHQTQVSGKKIPAAESMAGSNVKVSQIDKRQVAKESVVKNNNHHAKDNDLLRKVQDVRTRALNTIEHLDNINKALERTKSRSAEGLFAVSKFENDAFLFELDSMEFDDNGQDEKLKPIEDIKRENKFMTSVSEDKNTLKEKKQLLLILKKQLLLILTKKPLLILKKK